MSSAGNAPARPAPLGVLARRSRVGRNRRAGTPRAGPRPADHPVGRHQATETLTARRGQTARSSTALKHVARNPASLPGAGSRSAAVREQITADRPLRSAGSASLCFLFSHRERGQETLDAAASRTTRGRRGLADDQTRAATAPCASSATPPRGGGQAEASGNHGLVPGAASRQAGCEEVARAGPRAPGQRAERIRDKGHSLGPGDRTGSDWEGSAWEEDLAILRKSVALESHLGEKKNAG